MWVDNWFRLFANGAPLLEDSVAYRTERSFNAERFTFNADLPLTLAFEFRDFMQNETGLEYIGTRRQQLGDGGAIAQFRGRGNRRAAGGEQRRLAMPRRAIGAGRCVLREGVQSGCRRTRLR